MGFQLHRTSKEKFNQGPLASEKVKQGEPKLDSIKALIRRAAALDPRWMLDLDLSKITVPVMVGWGAEDIYMSPKGMTGLKRTSAAPCALS
jgi:pimeloyl-ACP methyl ester carboxylesterase